MDQRTLYSKSWPLILLCLLALLSASCKKTKESTIINNIGTGKPTFAVYGVSDMLLINNSLYNSTITRQLTVQYLDSAQQSVTLSLSPLPAGVILDSTNWTASGIPTFDTYFILHDTTAAGAVPGAYPMVITATPSSGQARQYGFILRIQGHATDFLRKFESCAATCLVGQQYSDSVFADPVIRNKIWFGNFRNSGFQVYALLTGSGYLNFPAQAFGSDSLNSGNGSLGSTPISVNINAVINHQDCYMQLR
jgi:hypothetical protein